MYCPRCSQQQISAETKFCSRCGLPLGVVAEVVAHDGFLPQLAESGKKKKFFTRRRGLIFALFWFMFFVLIMTPIASIENGNDAFVMAVLGTMGGLIMVIASFIFFKNEPQQTYLPNQNTETSNFGNLYQKNQNALPPQQSIPASTFVPPTRANWRETKDLVQPSVTEGTTKLLSKDE